MSTLLFCSAAGGHRRLHSFPTRRSSDLSCLIWLDLVASLPLIKERILVIILLLHFLSLMLGSVLVQDNHEYPFLDRKSGSAGMPRPISYAVFCLKKKRRGRSRRPAWPGS